MKIIFCNDLIYGGGVETMLSTIANYCVKKGYDVTVLASTKNTKDVYRYFDPEIHFIRSDWARKPYPKYSIRYFLNRFFRTLVNPVLKIYRIFLTRIRHYDVAVAFKEAAIMKETCNLKADKKIGWIHSDHRYSGSGRFLRKIFPTVQDEINCMKKFDKVVCCSETAREGVISTIGDTENLCVMYNPINWERIRKLSSEPCPINREHSKPLIVATGRLAKVKNYMLLLEAVNKLNDSVPLEVWIIGDGPERHNLEEYIKKNDLSNVRLLGYQPNPYKYIAMADLFVSTSVSESYGLSIQESFILGVPVVAVKCEGVAESFDSRFGVLIENSADRLAETVNRLFTNKNELQSIRRLIEENYSVNSLYEERLESICRLIES